MATQQNVWRKSNKTLEGDNSFAQEIEFPLALATQNDHVLQCYG